VTHHTCRHPKLRADVIASRKTRGARLDCGYLPEPKRPVSGWRYCQCRPQALEVAPIAA
jgi:hypothetical protein